jgi:hypothetical protein
MIHSSNPGRGKRFLSYPKHPDLLWDPPNLLFNGDQGVLNQSWSSKGMKLTTHLQLTPSLRMSVAILSLPQMPSLVCRGSTSPLVPLLWIFSFFLLINSAFNRLPQVLGHISLGRIKANHTTRNNGQQSCSEWRKKERGKKSILQNIRTAVRPQFKVCLSKNGFEHKQKKNLEWGKFNNDYWFGNYEQ